MNFQLGGFVLVIGEITSLAKPARHHQLDERRHRTVIVLGCPDERFLDVAFDTKSEGMGFRHDLFLTCGAALAVGLAATVSGGGAMIGIGGFGFRGSGQIRQPAADRGRFRDEPAQERSAA